MPDFKMQPNAFPVASVIDAAQRNSALQLQARTQGQQSLIDGFKAIGQVGQSLYEQKLRIAQALANAKMYGQTPEGQSILGTNQVTSGPMGQPVTRNQTAAYDPTTGTVTPNQSPVGIQDIAKSMEGMAPRDLFENLAKSQTARIQQGELDLKRQTEPQKIALDADLRKLLLGIQGQGATNTDVNNLLTRRAEAAKDLNDGKWHWGGNPKADEAKAEIARIDQQLSEKGYRKGGTIFSSQEEAARANLPDGTPITINGVRGKWKHR